MAERLTEPALKIEDLTPLDFCVLSHYHGAHFDQVVEEKLRKDLPIVTTEHAASELEGKGFIVTIALDTWNSPRPVQLCVYRDGAPSRKAGTFSLKFSARSSWGRSSWGSRAVFWKIFSSVRGFFRADHLAYKTGVVCVSWLP